MIPRRHWWKALLAIFVVGGAGVLYMGVQTYHGAPPIADFLAPDGKVIVSAETIRRGQAVFQKYALMQYGTLFGDGGARGPDFTADALHHMALSMIAYYEAGLPPATDERALEARDGIAARVRREIKENRFDSARGVVMLNEAQVAAARDVIEQTRTRFCGNGDGAFRPLGFISDGTELRELGAFFFWGGWVCGALRPGTDASYTQNWPFDPEAGNTFTRRALLWSVLGSLSMIVALGAVLYVYGRTRASAPAGDLEDPATTDRVAAFAPTPTQRATYKFFAVAAGLFLLQVIAGVFTVHDFVGLTNFFGVDVQRALPLPVVRSWHVQLSVLWIATCWIAGSLFLLPRITGMEPPGQVALVNALFWTLVAVVAGTVAGVLLGPKGVLGQWWSVFGNQGWEFVELGKAWQALLFGALILWAAIVWRGVRSSIGLTNPFSLPHWMLYSVTAIVMLFLSSFVAGPHTNFVIADFWRWMVIHMWAECFFEVFTTVVAAYFMVMMGLVGREAATRVVYFATLLFLGSGLLGISHNFYWNAKPEATLAIGSVFSTMQVVPLVLLTLEAWWMRRLPQDVLRRTGRAPASFAQTEAFLFMLGVNFWNFFGAGVFGFIINLPIVNYYEHGTYLTVNHGHAALMGVYGNLSIAAMLFCARYLIVPERWNALLLRASFWSINVGLMLTVVLDLFPAGVFQLQAVLERGMWYARSTRFIEGTTFQTLTWMRMLGGAMFLLGGVVPLAVFLLSRWRSLKPAVLPVDVPTSLRIEVPAVLTVEGNREAIVARGGPTP